ncbi:hypothetical protein GCM10010465_26910 [Actinomadura fibrosa]
MIKDTSLVGVDWLPIVFPNDHHIVLVRDPKNVFLSLLKGMTLKKHSIRNRLKKITKPLGIYPYTYSKKLSQLVLSQLPDLSNHKIIRYEALVQKEEQVLKELKSQFGCTKSIGQIKVEIDSIQVINSSFFKETGGKKIWDLKPRTSKFDPVNRKSENVLIQKGVELGSKKLRKKLNYI